MTFILLETKHTYVFSHYYIITGSEACSHFSVYYKHMAKRFKALSINSLVIARMDLTEASPPPTLNLVSGSLPLVIMFPAGQKMAPWTYYSGLSFFFLIYSYSISMHLDSSFHFYYKFNNFLTHFYFIILLATYSDTDFFHLLICSRHHSKIF